MNTEHEEKSVGQVPTNGKILPVEDEVSEEALDGITGGMEIYDPTKSYPPLRFHKLPVQTQSKKTTE